MPALQVAERERAAGHHSWCGETAHCSMRKRRVAEAGGSWAAVGRSPIRPSSTLLLFWGVWQGQVGEVYRSPADVAQT
jgi:hypothetical protein